MMGEIFKKHGVFICMVFKNQFNNNFAVIKMISNNPSRIQIINAKIFYNQSILSYRISYSERKYTYH